MIRPFDLLDVPLIAQLESQGTPLSSDALTRGARPLQAALANFFSMRSRGEYTLVMPDRPVGFAQMRFRKTMPRASVTFVAPGLAAGNGIAEVWAQLLDSLAVTAGDLGLHHLVAEVSEDSAEVSVLHRAGFAVSLRQDILRLKAGVVIQPPQDLLRPCVDTDLWGIQQLYLNTVPRLAQQAQAPPHTHHSSTVHGYVMEEGGEAVAYLEIQRGAAGALFNTLIHPQAEQQAREVIAQGLALLGQRWSLPVYCCVRRYQEWLWDPLQSIGFELSSSVAMMVKRLVVPATESERVAAPVLVQPKVTTPIVRSQHFKYPSRRDQFPRRQGRESKKAQVEGKCNRESLTI